MLEGLGGGIVSHVPSSQNSVAATQEAELQDLKVGPVPATATKVDAYLWKPRLQHEP